jgi:phosphate transport system ATP-binding protein
MSSSLELVGVSTWYGKQQALRSIDVQFPPGQVSAIIGPGGAGKSALLRLFNRLDDLQDGFVSEGTVLVDGVDVRDVPASKLRRRVGMVFDMPTAFPASIRENVCFGPLVAGVPVHQREVRMESALKRADLWEEVAGRLGSPARDLSSGARQRLCIARALALEPQVLLLDEPTTALHPREAARIERVVAALSGEVTVLWAMSQPALAGRVATYTALLQDGSLIEAAASEDLFTNPQRAETEAYLSGRY